jgi:alpha-tubulin suppressor-like RCC1 family protein
VLADGTVECAGDGTMVSTSTTNGAASIFNTITYHLSDLTPIPGLADVQSMSIGDSFACARTSTDVLCWGDNSNRQLGQGGTDTTDITTPVAVMGLGAVDDLDAGDQFACARVGLSIQCWGDNDNRQTGEDATTTDQSLPFTVPLINDAIDVQCGENHACALRGGGVVSCWGDDGASQLGDNDGNTNDTGIPVDVTGLPGAASQLVVGQDHSCALVGTDVYCWGDASRGQLGQGDELDSDTAVLVPGLGNVVQIEAGFNFTCAVMDTGDMSCWGYGLDGQLGNGGEELTGLDEFLSPVPFEVATGINDVAASNAYTCVDIGAGWQCLGFRSSGQLANGTAVETSYPTPMLFGL